MNTREATKKISRDGYSDAINRDDFSLCNPEWRQAIKDNPTLYCSAKQNHDADLTEVHAAISSGRFFGADDILLQENGTFMPDATPCLSGAYHSNAGCQNSLSSALKSAGSNFYLAQMVYRFYSENHAATEMYQDLISKRASYLDTIYWLKGNEKIHYTADKKTQARLKEIIKNAPAFWELAKEAVEKQRTVASEECPTEIRELYLNDIGDIHLRLAMAETKSQHAYRWLLLKAKASYSQAQATEKLSHLIDYVDIDNGTDTEIQDRIFAKFKEQTEQDKSNLISQINSVTNIKPETINGGAQADRELARTPTPDGVESVTRLSNDDDSRAASTNSFQLRKLKKGPATPSSGTATNPMHKVYSNPNAVKQTFAGRNAAAVAAQAEPTPTTPNVKPKIGKQKLS